MRAALELDILGLVASEPAHGYAITTRLADAGFGRLRGGSIYPVLARHEDAGHVACGWVEPQAGPGRKDYAITAEGRRRLERDAQAWDGFAETVRRLAAGGSACAAAGRSAVQALHEPAHQTPMNHKPNATRGPA